jgi:hypothetical protein
MKVLIGRSFISPVRFMMEVAVSPWTSLGTD